MEKMYLLRLLILVFIFVECSDKTNEEIEGLSIQHQVFIDRPIEEVYRSYTTKTGLEGFLAPNVKIDLVVDSTLITSPEIGANLDEPGHVKNKILAAEEPNKLQMKIDYAPPYLPYSNELTNLHTLIEFKSKNNGTEVNGTTHGFDKLSDSSLLIGLFKSINQFTLDQLKNYHEGSRVDWRKFSDPNSPEKRISEFKQDDIWIKTYRMFDVKVRRPMLNHAIDMTSEMMGMESDNVSMLFFIATNLNEKGFGVKEFKLRMPYAKDSFVKERLQDLIEDQLISKANDYKLTDLGRQLVNEIVEQINNQTIPKLNIDEQNIVIKMFEDIIGEATKPGFRFRYPSSVERSSAWIKKGTTNQLKLVLLMDGMNTLINDVAHYGFENLQEYEPSQLAISFPEREIMGSISYNKGFKLDSFLSRAVWGYGENETLNYLRNLIRKNLVAVSSQDTVISEFGKSLSQRSAMLGDKIFYTSWLCLKPSDYQSYKNIIDKYSEE